MILVELDTSSVEIILWIKSLSKNSMNYLSLESRLHISCRTMSLPVKIPEQDWFHQVTNCYSSRRALAVHAAFPVALHPLSACLALFPVSGNSSSPELQPDLDILSAGSSGRIPHSFAEQQHAVRTGPVWSENGKSSSFLSFFCKWIRFWKLCAFIRRKSFKKWNEY